MALSKHYGAYRDSLIRLHELIAKNADETPEGESLRDDMDTIWTELNVGEISLVRLLSADLYGPDPDANNRDAAVELQRIFKTAKLSPTQGIRWQDVHKALSGCEGLLEANAVLYFKSRIWNEFGDPVAALWFVRKSLELQPDNTNIRYLYLNQLARTNPTEALQEAKEILDSPEKPALILFKAADILFSHAEDDQHPIPNDYVAIIYLYSKALDDAKKPGQGNIPASVIFGARVHVGISLKRLGDFDQAETYFTLAAQTNPESSIAWISRGILNYGRKTEEAILDFEQAIQLMAPVVWPYFFMAHWTLKNLEFDRCLAYCAEASKFPRTPEVEAELIQWATLSKFFLTGDSSNVLQQLQAAHELFPQNKSIAKNVEDFSELIASASPNDWSIPEDAEVSNIADLNWEPVVQEEESLVFAG